MSIVELTSGSEHPAADFTTSGRVSVSEPVDEDQQVRRRDKDIKTKRKLNETPSMLDPVICHLDKFTVNLINDNKFQK